MTTSSAAASTAIHLRTCALHWTDLRDALGQPAIHHGFGIGLQAHLTALEDADEQRKQATILRALERDPIQIGQRPVPVRLHILDTMHAIETALVDLADQTAAEVQRSPMAGAPSGWPAADRARRDALASADAADKRRWKYTGQRTAPYAALWLLARIEQRGGGPFRPLDDRQRARIGAVAESAAGRMERALDIAAQRKTLERLHECGGRIDVHGGEGRPPVGHCTGCGAIWTESGAVAA